MPSTNRIPVLAFTECQLPYRNMSINSELNIKFCTDLNQFFDEMLNCDYSGLLLEMKKVMQTPATHRDKIFSLAADRPILRVKTKSKIAVLVDDPDKFKARCQHNENGLIRQYQRANVKSQIQISTDDDRAMAKRHCGIVVNISETGCFFQTKTDFSNSKFINLKFHDINNKLPIYSGIRWMSRLKNELFGYGVQFVSIHKEQTSELLYKLIIPNL